MECVAHTDLPLVYDLRLHVSKPAVVFKPTASMESMLCKHLAAPPPLFTEMKQSLPLSEFVPFGTGAWGCGGLVKHHRDGWMFPLVADQGLDQSFNLHLFLTIASLIAFEHWDIDKRKTVAEPPLQAAAISAIVVEARYGISSCWAVVSPAGAAWMSNQDNYDHVMVEMQHAAKAAWSKIDSRPESAEQKRYRRYALKEIRIVPNTPPRFSISLPGMSCCCMFVDPDYMPGEGFRVVPHNNDNRVQQFTFLAALTRMCELINAGVNAAI